MRTMMLIATLVAFGVMAGDVDPKMTEAISKLTGEYFTKKKAAQTRLIANLKKEVTQAQASNKLTLALDIRARLAALEGAIENPLGNAAEMEDLPVKGSTSEAMFEKEMDIVEKEMGVKAKAFENQFVMPLRAKQAGLVKAGKIDEAATIEETLADVQSFLNMFGDSKYVGKWKWSHAKSVVELKADKTFTEDNVDMGTWKVENRKVFILYSKKEKAVLSGSDKQLKGLYGVSKEVELNRLKSAN